MRRSDHPNRPSAITCCRLSALKTLDLPAASTKPTAQVNVSTPGAALAGFQVSIIGRFWVSTEGLSAKKRWWYRVDRRGRTVMAAMKRGARRKETGLKLGYGWIPDLPDHRDILYGAVHRVAARLPASVDLRRGCSPVEDQGDLGSCTGNALAGAVEFLEKKDGIPLVNVSRLFIYYNERVIEHTVADDAGAMIRDGIKTLVKQGTCSEKRWPYVIARFAVKPSAACYREAADHQVTAYARLQTLVAMRACLAGGDPFVFGFTGDE